MSWGYVAVAAGTVISGYMGSKGAKDGADAQVGAANYAADLQNRQWEQTRQDMMPWMDALLIISEIIKSQKSAVLFLYI